MLLPPAADDATTSVFEHRKRVVEKVELAQNIARENLQLSQQKMKEYYDRNTKQPVFEVGQRVWVYTPKTKKGLSNKLLHNWFGPYRIVKKCSPVHFRLPTEQNKQVTFAVHANRMKPFVDPSSRPIDPPVGDDLSEPYLEETDISLDSFENEQSTGVTNDPKTCSETLVASQPQPTSQKSVIDNQSVFRAEKILQSRKKKGKNNFY